MILALTTLPTGCGGGDESSSPKTTGQALESGAGARGLLLITIDTLRVDRLGAFGRPAAGTACLDALARRSTLFPRAYAHAPLTLPAHTSILTGLLPLDHGVRDNGLYALEDRAVTLADVLRDEGFSTGGFVGGFPLSRRFGLAQSFDVYDDDFSVDPRPGANFLYSERRGRFVTDAALRFAREHSDRDLFIWTHYYDPHARYDPIEPFDSRYADDLYQGEIAYTDRCIERLLAGLDELDRLDDFLVVVTADHGEGLGEHGEETHGIFVYDFAVRVPLLIGGAGRDAIAPALVDSIVRHVDLMPTALDLLGIGVPQDLDGESLAGALRSSEADVGERTAYFESYALDYQYGWSKLFGVARGDQKWIDAPQPELYDLVVDPLEMKNLASGGRGDDLARDLAGLRAEASSDPPAATRVVSSDERRRLAALGYVQDETVGDGELLDPKEAVPLANQLNDAQELASSGRLEEAEPLVRSILARNPNNSLAWTVLANVLFGAGRLDDAVDANREAISRNPTLAYAYRNVGKIRLRQQRFEEAQGEYDMAVELEPESIKGRLGLARVLLARGNTSEALEELAVAATLEPHEYASHFELGEIYARLDRPREALLAYERSVRAPPSSPTPYLKLGGLLSALGEEDRARKAYEEAVGIFPESAPLHNAAGLVEARAGRLDAAVTAFERALELAPQGLAASNLAAVFLRQGKPEEAERALRRGVAVERPNRKTIRALGMLLATRLERPGEAREWLERTLESDPSDDEVRQLLERIR